MSDFFAGLRDYMSGYGLVLSVPSIRKWALIPMALNLLLFTALAFLVFWFAGDAVRAIFGEAHSWYGRVGHVLMWIVTLLVGLLAVVALSLVLSSVIAAPFYTRLAEATLRHLTGREIGVAGPVWKMALVSIWQEMQKLAIFLGVQAVLLGIGFIPLIGIVVSIGVTVLLLAFEFADYALEAYGLGVTDRYRFVLARKAGFAGFGAGVFVTTLVPFLNIVTAPAAVAGAARMVARLKGDANVR